jgi:hypothetical protein
MVMELPNLKHDYHHALIDSVRIGPRREVTMTIQALLWEGQRGYGSPNIYIRCGGITNLDEVKAFFGKCPSLEVAWLGYAESQKSKPGNLFIELQSERTDDKLIIQCSSINVADSE